MTGFETIPAPPDSERTSPHHEIPERSLADEMRTVFRQVLEEELGPVKSEMHELCATFTREAGQIADRVELLSTQVVAMNASLDMATNAYRLHAERTDAAITHQESRIKTLEATVERQDREIAELKKHVGELERDVTRALDQ